MATPQEPSEPPLRLTVQAARYGVSASTSLHRLWLPPPSGCFHRLLHLHQIHRDQTWTQHKEEDDMLWCSPYVGHACLPSGPPQHLFSLPPSVRISPVIKECRLPSVVAKVAIGILGGVPTTSIWQETKIEPNDDRFQALFYYNIYRRT